MLVFHEFHEFNDLSEQLDHCNEHMLPERPQGVAAARIK
jgi:hypothetical protein